MSRVVVPRLLLSRLAKWVSGLNFLAAWMQSASGLGAASGPLPRRRSRRRSRCPNRDAACASPSGGSLCFAAAGGVARCLALVALAVFAESACMSALHPAFSACWAFVFPCASLHLTSDFVQSWHHTAVSFHEGWESAFRSFRTSA